MRRELNELKTLLRTALELSKKERRWTSKACSFIQKDNFTAAESALRQKLKIKHEQLQNDIEICRFMMKMSETVEKSGYYEQELTKLEYTYSLV